MVSDVLVRGPAGWNSIQGGIAVPGSVKGAKADLAFADITGQHDPAGAAKHIRNLANDAWIPLDTYTPPPLFSLSHTFDTGGGGSWSGDVPLGPEAPDRVVMVVIMARGASDPTITGAFNSSTGAPMNLLNNYGWLPQSGTAYNFAGAAYSLPAPTGATFPLRIDGGAPTNRYVYVFTGYVGARVIDLTLSATLRNYDTGGGLGQRLNESLGPWRLFSTSTVVGDDGAPNASVSSNPVNINGVDTQYATNGPASAIAYRAIDAVGSVQPPVGHDITYLWTTAGNARGDTYVFNFGFQ